MGRVYDLWDQPNLNSVFTRCVTLGKSLNMPDPIPNQERGGINTILRGI